jgi:5S rRNA maturation endonuclease (ribonuclease M5)
MANPNIPKNINNDTLREIRDNTDWRELFRYLGLERDKKSTERDWWAKSPLNPGEKTASFHMNDQGWTCFSTNEGGYVIELVQKVVGGRTGQMMNCYQAGRWLLENDLSRVSTGSKKASVPRKKGESSTCNMEIGGNTGDEEGIGTNREGVGKRGETEKDDSTKKENIPIRQTLLPSLDIEHPEFNKRGISQGTCAYLGCGHLPENSNSPMAGRLVFQVRGVQEDEKQSLHPAVLTHMGRATTKEQEEQGGKWWIYGGFSKTLELYNIDHAILDKEAVRQAQETGHVIVTEGCFDVAKLVEAGVRNAVATFGAHLAEEQIERLKQIAEKTGVRNFLFWYDRDKAGKNGQEKVLEALETGETISAKAFDWEMSFPSPVRGDVKIPEGIGDVCEFSVDQLRWMRDKKII